ncbi:MAG: hypothetical protein HC875_15280 [Anaerolineales bacterium]|nr:hypothetical protein [Anaerolineales bacterium]
MKKQTQKNKNLPHYHELITEFYDFAKQNLGFKNDPKLFFIDDEKNSKDPLCQTGYYSPEKQEIYVYTTARHPKDILRSFAHELIHHLQNSRGEFKNGVKTQEGYAQEDNHLRKMEEEAYSVGNLLLRDWTDGRQKNGR